MKRAAALLLSIWTAGAAHAFGAVVTRVSDGDTLFVQPDDRGRKPLKVRLRDIDAPERCQAWGEEARAALAQRVLGRRVEIRPRSRDDWQRVIAALSLGDDDIGAWMVAEGHAWSTRWRGAPARYAAEERAARAARRGVHAHAGAVEPWRFRSRHGPCTRGRSRLQR